MPFPSQKRECLHQPQQHELCATPVPEGGILLVHLGAQQQSTYRFVRKLVLGHLRHSGLSPLGPEKLLNMSHH